MKILVVGQTPPPHGGQAFTIKCMLDTGFKAIKLYHLRMSFSKDTREMGFISFYKIKHLISLILKTYILKFKYNIRYLYYPLSNAPKVSIYRDVIYLLFTRYLFKGVIFHFHAAGISEELPKMNFLFQAIAKIILKNPNLTITASQYNPRDGEFLGAKKNIIIPYGIPDYNERGSFPNKDYEMLKILFVGKLNLTKGEGYLLDAMAILKDRGYSTKLQLGGQFDSDEHYKLFFEKVSKYNLVDSVEYLGIIIGDKKVKAFENANVFCFPSYFISESFGIVLLEAMQFGLPLIATNWRGIQDVVEDGKNGFLVDIKNAVQIADKMEQLILDRKLMLKLSENSRQIFLKKYTLSNYIKNLESAFLIIK